MSMEYTSWATGTAAKYARCEKCGAEYGYTMFQTATGHGTSLLFLDNQGAAERATQRGEQALREELDRAVKPASCPRCHHLQADMVQAARDAYLPWLSFKTVWVALLLTPIAVTVTLLILNAVSGQGPMLVPVEAFFAVWGGIVVLMCLLPVLRLFLANRYDPNRLSAEERFARGIYDGIPLDEWEKTQAKDAEMFRNMGAHFVPPNHPRPQPPPSDGAGK